MIEITPTIILDESELQFDYIRSSGPGGQNVNKVATAVQVRFDVNASTSLPDGVKQRLLRLAGSRVTREGVLVIEAKRYRTQNQNRGDALQRLVSLIQRAVDQPKPRRRTKPSLAAQRKRLENKKMRSQIKQLRQKPGGEI